jgi:hypothetical protein
MKSKLAAYGRIQKGRHCQYLMVVLDDRLSPAGGRYGSRWRRTLRFFCPSRSRVVENQF